jgi:pimeloyl-ACP methyl ester carboxylesterase
MRAGFEVYRAFDRDAEDNRAALKKKGRLTMPVLALGGTASFYLPIAKAMLAEVAKDVTVVAIPESGHWIAEENPRALLEELTKFSH